MLEHITIPNVLVNTKSIEKLREKCKFYSGDWSCYIDKTKDKVDFILTSETIYNAANYDKLIDVIKTQLKFGGTCYLAGEYVYCNCIRDVTPSDSFKFFVFPVNAYK